MKIGIVPSTEVRKLHICCVQTDLCRKPYFLSLLILIFFFNTEYAVCCITPNNYTLSYNGIHVGKTYHSLKSLGTIQI